MFLFWKGMVKFMKIVGMNYSVNSEGMRITTLHVLDEFDGYYNNPSSGRGCAGQKAESIYMGTYDCSKLKVGMSIDVLYDKAVSTSKGTFQKIKKVEILGS